MATTTKKRLRRAAKGRERRYTLGRRLPGARDLHEFRPEPPLDPDDLDGGAGVREPRRPRPSAPVGAIELDQPEAQLLDLTR